jgi:putative nucleotidyltransferase with HDIG domain
MLHKLRVTDLRPGMYVADLGLSVLEYPHVYPRAGLLRSTQQIEDIIDKGFTEAFVDEEQSTVAVGTQESFGDLAGNAAPEKKALVLPSPRVVHEHMEQAITMYASAIETTETLFSSLEKGKALPVESVYAVADSVVGSIMNDNLTLATVTKLQAHDNYTFAHSVNVSVLATMFSRHLDMEESALQQVAVAGLLHDIGKIAIPNKLLNTARQLKDDEFEVMKQHPLAGYEALKATAVPKTVKLAVLEHHERYNGTGYPYGKKGDEISLMGRILSLVDVYDALTSKRAYKPPLIPYTAVSFLYSQRGQHFESALVDRFIQCVGVYPVGSVILLRSGEIGVVYLANPASPLRPVVALVMDAQGTRIPLRLVDLNAAPGMKVKSCLDPVQAGVNAGSIIKACALAQKPAGLSSGEFIPPAAGSAFASRPPRAGRG